MKSIHNRNNIRQNKFPFIALLFISLLFINVCSFSYYKKGALNNNSNNVTYTEPGYSSINFNPDTVSSIVTQESFIKAGLLFDMSKNKLVWLKGINNRCDIASLSKMMTILIVIECIRLGKYNWESLVKIPREAMYVGGSSVYLREGEVFTVRDLVKSSLIASGNDACYTLAVYTAGNEKLFARIMNWQAEELGMDSTYYTNSTGMPTFGRGADNFSTPHDLLLLANELLKYKEVLAYTSESEDYIYHGLDKFSFENHNTLVGNYKNDVDGLKTGFTPGAGFCLVATANRANHRIINIILGVKNSGKRDEIVAEMMSNYYNKIGLGKLGEPISKSSGN
jgi:D-alanyl-D-alanine carboxypeptidase (penicillin-binding protein 5/6)